MFFPWNGLRVFWDGTSLQHTDGTPIPLPPRLKSELPNVEFEAFLRGSIHGSDANVTLLAFECPLMFSSSYEERIALLSKSR